MASDKQLAELARVVQEIRTSHAPEADAAGTKVTVCHDCGYSFTQRKRSYKDACPQCSGDRLVRAGQQMRNREGEYYQRAVVKQLAYWTAEAERIGLRRSGA